MKKCSNCGCKNSKTAKECAQCRSVFLFGGISYKPQELNRITKFTMTISGLILILFESAILYNSLKESILILMEGYINLDNIFYIITSGFLTVPTLILLIFAYVLHFMVKNSIK